MFRHDSPLVTRRVFQDNSFHDFSLRPKKANWSAVFGLPFWAAFEDVCNVCCRTVTNPFPCHLHNISKMTESSLTMILASSSDAAHQLHGAGWVEFWQQFLTQVSSTAGSSSHSCVLITKHGRWSSEDCSKESISALFVPLVTTSLLPLSNAQLFVTRAMVEALLVAI